jgi:hypothetical protein
MSDIELQRLLDFDEDDLVANRECRLSPKQEKRIKETELLNGRIFKGAGIILILITLVNAYSVILTAIKQGFSLSTISQSDIAAMVIAIGIPGLFLSFVAWGAFKIAAYRADHSVQPVRGKVRFVKVGKIISEKRPNGSLSYQMIEEYGLRVGNVNFENVNQNIMTFIEPGDIYAFYYIRDSRDILSVELLAKGK